MPLPTAPAFCATGLVSMMLARDAYRLELEVHVLLAPPVAIGACIFAPLAAGALPIWTPWRLDCATHQRSIVSAPRPEPGMTV